MNLSGSRLIHINLYYLDTNYFRFILVTKIHLHLLSLIMEVFFQLELFS